MSAYYWTQMTTPRRHWPQRFQLSIGFVFHQGPRDCPDRMAFVLFLKLGERMLFQMTVRYEPVQESPEKIRVAYDEVWPRLSAVVLIHRRNTLSVSKPRRDCLHTKRWNCRSQPRYV